MGAGSKCPRHGNSVKETSGLQTSDILIDARMRHDSFQLSEIGSLLTFAGTAVISLCQTAQSMSVLWSENDRGRAISDQSERRPIDRRAVSRPLKIIQFGLPEREGFVLSLRQVRVESLHQSFRRGIFNIPQRSDHTFGAGKQEGFRQSIDSLFAFELSVRRIAS